jgi:hypothetical protein
VARPMPEVPPVMTITCWSSGFSLGFIGKSPGAAVKREAGAAVPATIGPKTRAGSAARRS